MNRYILIRRMKGPAILLLVGTVALLHEADLASWSLLLPLFLILIGVLKLAERAALAAAGDEELYPGTYPGTYPGAYPGAYPPHGVTPQGGQATAVVPAPPQELKGTQGGQS
ncbi:MAG: hypothetical protein WCA37_03065 [Terracidiphilus sp.]